MSVIPAKKKHASTRRRQNKASTAATLSATADPDVDRSGWTAAQLRAEIDRRNVGRAEDERLSKGGGKKGMLDVLAGDDSTIPPLPDRGDLLWHRMTEEWWTDVWTSPMSSEWHPETDFHNVFMAAMHYDDMMRAPDANARQKAHAAYLKTIAPLGLTPYDRRRLEWTIATAETATAAGQRRRERDGSKPPAAAAPARPDPRGIYAVR